MQLRQNGLALRSKMVHCQTETAVWGISMDIADHESEEYFVHCGCRKYISMLVGRDLEDDALLREDPIDDDKSELILLTLPPRRPDFQRGRSVLSL